MASKYADLDDQERVEKAQEFSEIIKRMESEIQNGYIGQEDVIRKILLAVVAGGNVLLEGVPGLGKSLLVELLGRTVEGTSFNRVQFTPDLLPADIIGVEAYNEDRGFYIEKGPIFANFILADEINRAPPKVQSAMLEAMQEHKVSIGDETFHLDEPFFVMATQNPTEQGGSLPLDETLYMDGQLWNAGDALEHAREHGITVHDEEDMKLHRLDATAPSLQQSGEMEETDVMVYEKEYDGALYTIRTKTGRSITVTGNHPVLVNEQGRVIWKDAAELEEDDYLVQPASIPQTDNEFSSHNEVIERLGYQGHDITTRDEVKDVKEHLEAGNDLSRDDIDTLRKAAGLSKKELAAKTDLSYDQILNYIDGAENEQAQTAINGVLDTEELAEAAIAESFGINTLPDLDPEDAGFLIGFILAEGSIDDAQFELSQKNHPQLYERVRSLFEDHDIRYRERVKDGTPHIAVDSQAIIAYLRERYHLDEPEQLLDAPLAFRTELLNTLILTESHFDRENKRITFTQQDETLTNVVAHLLIQHDVQPWVMEDEDKYRIRIQGADLATYLETFDWPGTEPDLDGIRSHTRTVPVPPALIDRLVADLGFKMDGTTISEQEWYGAYKTGKERGRIGEQTLETFITAMRTRLEENRARNDSLDDIQTAAHRCGLAMTDIVEATGATKHAVWQAYQGNQAPADEMVQYVEGVQEQRLDEAEQLIQYLEYLLSADVIYDPITSIESEPHQGTVTGLAVPGSHNYVAGMGACGINHNTYPLPEAQIDRFLFKIYLDYPKKKNERKIIDMNANIMDDEDFGVNTAVQKQDIINVQEFTKVVKVTEDVKAYIVDLVDATRNPGDYGLEYSEYIDWGGTPRASINTALAARAHAIYHGRDYVTPEDIRAVLRDVFIHRIILNYEGQAQGIEVDDVIDDIKDNVPVV